MLFFGGRGTKFGICETLAWLGWMAFVLHMVTAYFLKGETSANFDVSNNSACVSDAFLCETIILKGALVRVKEFTLSGSTWLVGVACRHIVCDHDG